MDGIESLTPDDATELRRLCGLYDEAKETGDIDLCRQIRAAISDFVGSITTQDAELAARLRAALGFPTEPSATALDQ